MHISHPKDRDAVLTEVVSRKTDTSYFVFRENGMSYREHDMR